MVSDAQLNPTLDLSNTTTSAYRRIDKIRNTNAIPLLDKVDTSNNPHNKVRVKIYTPFDDKTHTYFHSMSIDKDVADFMGTAELRCPYDSDLMAYWEPARAYCVIYGTNHGDYKVLFIGRVREVNQQGYEIVVSLQDYGWKFKQLVTQSYANDNVINKDGYTIMKLIFQALKIDSWVVTPTAKYRLQQVGIDEDGNVTLNKKKIEKMPDLLKRIKASNPNKAINKYTVYNKTKESELHNLKNINYTLKYEKPTKIMKKTASDGSYEPGASMYGTNYGASSDTSGGGGSAPHNQASATVSASGNQRPPNWVCSIVKSETINAAMKVVWSYNRGYNNSYQSALNTLTQYASYSPSLYRSQAAPCLATMAKNVTRPDGTNAASIIKSRADAAANRASIMGTTPMNRSKGNQVRGAGSNKSTPPKKNGLFGWGFLGL